MTRPLPDPLPLVVHIPLYLSDLFLLQMSVSSLFQEILLDRETAWFTVDGVSLPILHFVEGKDVRFHGENGQFRGKVCRCPPTCWTRNQHMNELGPSDTLSLCDLLL